MRRECRAWAHAASRQCEERRLESSVPARARSSAGDPAQRSLPPASGAGGRSGRPRPSRASRRSGSSPRQRAGGRSPRARAATEGRARPSARRGRARSGAPSSATASDVRERSPPERSRTSEPVRSRRPTVSTTASMRSCPPTRAAKYCRFSDTVRSRVYRRRLRHVGDALAKRGRACGQAEHGEPAARDPLHAHDRAEQRRLAAAARAEQSGDCAGRHLDREVRQDRATAPFDAQILDDDR